MRRSARVCLSWGSALALVLVLFPSVLGAQASGKGNLIGYVFEEKGSTPVAGVVVVVRNLTSGVVTEAFPSDGLGVFKAVGLEAGLYALGVRSERGRYNSQDFFGVTADKTAKISIALDSYDPAAASAAEVVVREQREKGEAFIGKVVQYLPGSKEAEVFIEVGLIQADDRIHVKGQVTDFYQDMRTLKSEGVKTKRVLSGGTALLRTTKPCEPGDFVYLVCKRGIPPFFLAPLGIAAIVAGSTPLAAIYEEEPVSEYRVKH